MTSLRRRTRLSAPKFVLHTCAAALLCGSPIRAQVEIPINSKRLGDRVLVTWACHHFQGTNMEVVETDEGLVIIDTGLSPTTVRRQRALVERELGRSDFRYLVNTHMHNDHAFANVVFPEATVVGHGNGVAALELEISRIPELLDRLRHSGERYTAWAADTSPDSASGQHAREGVAAFGVGIGDLEAGITPRYPTVTFDTHHTLQVGAVRFELFDFTGFHSESDILILVPEESMLFTGDVFWGGQLPFLRDMTPTGINRLLENWDAILDLAPDLETIVPGHSDVPLTVVYFKTVHQYLSQLRADVQAAREAGTDLVRFLRQHSLKERYPEVAEYNYTVGDYNVHQHNIYMMWQAVGG